MQKRAVQSVKCGGHSELTCLVVADLAESVEEDERNGGGNPFEVVQRAEGHGLDEDTTGEEE